MNEKREEWNKILNITTEMIKLAHERNNLLKEAEAKEKEIRTMEKEYNEFLIYIKEFNKKYVNGALDEQIRFINIFLRKRLSELKHENRTYLLKYNKTIRMYYKITSYKDSLESFLSVFKNLKLTKEEVMKQDAKKLTALILMANDKDYTITEENFFADEDAKKAYFEMLPEGIMLYKNTITKSETLDEYLGTL